MEGYYFENTKNSRDTPGIHLHLRERPEVRKVFICWPGR